MPEMVSVSASEIQELRESKERLEARAAELARVARTLSATNRVLMRATSARIMAVVDVYDAARSPRCYKKGLSHEEVCTVILAEAGKQFDPGGVAAFKSLQQAFHDSWQEMAS